MAEKSLVTQEDLADGARLIQELDLASFPITAAFWAYDSLLETWRLMIAAPREAIESLVAAYGIIQGIIDNANLRITLDRVSLIPDNDPKLKNLQALAQSDARDVLEASVGRAEIAGRVLDDIHIYKHDALQYEQVVIGALQRIQTSNVIMRTYRQSDFPRDLGADALLDDGEHVVLIEVKARSGPIGPRDIFELEGRLHNYERYFGRRAAAILVSRSGFTHSAMAARQGSRIILVEWTGPADDERLQQALTEARASLSR